MAISGYIEKNLEVDFENGDTLLHRYDEKDKTWYTHDAEMLVAEIEYSAPVLQDELLIAKLKKERFNNKSIEMDIMFFNIINSFHKISEHRIYQ